MTSNSYRVPMLQILYRLLKTYNIPIIEDTIRKAFIDTDTRLIVDMMFLRYVRRIEGNDAYEEEHMILCRAVDYIWTKFIYEHYDMLNFLTKGSPFMLGRKEQIEKLLTNLPFARQYGNNSEDISTALKCYPEFKFNFAKMHKKIEIK